MERSWRETRQRLRIPPPALTDHFAKQRLTRIPVTFLRVQNQCSSAHLHEVINLLALLHGQRLGNDECANAAVFVCEQSAQVGGRARLEV